MERLAFAYVTESPAGGQESLVDAGLTERIQVLGGEIAWAGTEEVLAVFDALDLPAVVELGLALHASLAVSPAVRIGIALDAVRGDDDPVEPTSFEQTIERARRIAWAAAPSELVLDEVARDAAAGVYLFDSMSSPLGAHRIDRREPRRAPCRRAVRHLHAAPLPSNLTRSLLPLVTEVIEPGLFRYVLRGGSSDALHRAIAWMEERIGPRVTLSVSGVPGGLEPLGSLRNALLALGLGSESGYAHLELKPLVGRTLTRITRAEPVSRAEAVRAVASFFDASENASNPVWLIVDGTSSIDASSLEVLAEAVERVTTNLLVTTLLLDGTSSEALGGFDRGREFVLPNLGPADALEFSAAILGPHVEREIVTHVALRGGSSLIGIEEAARSMVASGDLVFREGRFVWRCPPRHPGGVVPVEALVGERLVALDEAPHRVLDVICVVPRGASEELIQSVAAADGLEPSLCRDAIAQLRDEGFVASGTPIRPSSDAVRAAVRDAMPPAREAELERFIAEGLTLDDAGVFARATQGYFLAQGGRPREAAEALLGAGHAAIAEGFGRAAVSLAAAAVQCHPSSEVRGPAAVIARAARSLASASIAAPGRSSTIPAPPDDMLVVTAAVPAEESLSRRVVLALLGRDFETLERCLDLAIAEGADRAAAARLRAVGCIARGDRASAYCELEKARVSHDDHPHRAARDGVARAIVLLQDGRSLEAVAAGLSALEAARRGHDLRGEGAALHVLAACYRGLGRDDDAERLEEASPI